ncbi:hypothetical protein GP2_031_00350 [Gordonia paraffinivorans NBRC 108238]|uniref:DUF3800 domain-containing protein n=1 Tax=Gordonia paraffinivorans NBRC 108238 TaxID=1223543 RepID=A0ABQ0INU0_9ACTN|nr:hypothetical protein [Gordonia paraffinivorans]GAC85223.1 hypothetical protein GP2_031_00350 [Gordonia paraffinivorans NBRC 108238]
MGFSDAEAQILAEAYRGTKNPVAYLDESYQAPDPITAHRSTFYLFTAVIVAHESMDELRDGLRQIADSNWWHTTDALQEPRGLAATKDMLDFLAEGGETCVVAHQVPVDSSDHDAEEARRACYRALGTELAAGKPGGWDPVELFVLEKRNQSNFRNKDAKNHKELVREQAIPRHTRLLQTSPSIERLLWLPDLVSAAYRRTITHSDASSELFEIVKQRVHFINVTP